MPEALARSKNALSSGRRFAAADVLPRVALPLASVGLLTGSAARFLARRVSSRPAATVAGAAFAALLTAVALNALFFQKARHLAPLFKAQTAAAPALSAPVARLQNAVPPPPVAPAQGGDSVTGSTRPAPENVPRPVDAETDAALLHRTAPAAQHPKSSRHAKAAAKLNKAKRPDRITQFLRSETPHRHHVKHDEQQP